MCVRCRKTPEKESGVSVRVSGRVRVHKHVRNHQFGMVGWHNEHKMSNYKCFAETEQAMEKANQVKMWKRKKYANIILFLDMEWLPPYFLSFSKSSAA